MTSLRLVTVLALALSACADAPTAEQQQVESSREQFSNALHGSYMFTWRRGCECTAETTAPIRITVQAGQIIQAVYVETSLAVSNEVRQGLQTIDGVFDTIADAYANGAASVDVTYDPTTAYPASVGIDYNLQIADEELSLQLTDVQVFEAN